MSKAYARPAGTAAILSRLHTWQNSAASLVIFAIAALALAYLVVLPIGFMFIQSFMDEQGRFTLTNYSYVFNNRGLYRAFVNTILASLGVALLSIVIGTPLAFGVARTRMWGKALVRIAVIVAIVSPPFLMTIAYIQLAGPNNGYLNQLLRALLVATDYGPLNIFTIWAFVFLAVPNGVAFVFLQLAPAFNNMDPSLEEAGRMMGARPARTVFSITLPLMLPAILSGGLLAFSTTLAIYGTAHILNLEVMTMAIRKALLSRLDFPTAATLSVTVVAISLVALYVYRWIVRRGEAYQTLGGRGFRPSLMEIGRWRHLFTAIGLVFGLSTAFVPYGLMLLTSFLPAAGQDLFTLDFTLRNYAFVLNTPFIREALANSLILATASATVVTILGVIIGYIVTRTRLSGRAVLDYISILPLGVAGTALAVGIVIVHLNAPFNSLGIYGTLWIMLVAYAARFIAFGVRNSQTALMQVSRELEEAARVHGATQLKTIALIILPLIKGPLIYTWILVFILAFPEVSASIILRGVDTDVSATALLEVWDGTGGLPVACALGMVIFAIIGIPVLLLQHFGGRSVLDARG